MKAKKLTINLVLLSLVVPAALVAPKTLNEQPNQGTVASCMAASKEEAVNQILEQILQPKSESTGSVIELDLHSDKKESHSKPKHNKHNTDKFILGGSEAITM